MPTHNHTEGPGLHRDHAFLSRLCREAKAFNAPALPLYRAALARELDLVSLGDPEQPWPAVPIALAERPIVVLVSDDPRGRAALGPHCWQAAPSMRGWLRWAVVHGSCGTVRWPYEAAVDAARLFGRAVVIKTSSGQAERWAEFLQVPCIIIKPTGGAAHPIMEYAT